MINDYQEQAPNLIIDDQGKFYMQETARWGKFLAIVALCMIALALLLMPFILGMAFREGVGMGRGLGAAFSLFYMIVIAGIYFYPLYALMKFSNLTRRAIAHTDQETFNLALRFQKNLYKYIGVLTIIMLVAYGIGIVFMLTVAATASL